MTTLTKQQRCDEANKVLLACSRHGRRFFSEFSDRRDRFECGEGRVSRFEIGLDGKLWYFDKYRGDRVNTSEGGFGYSFGRGFTEGGTLRDLCRNLAKYIRTGKPISPGHFGPFPSWACDGDVWGYGAEEMAKVRAEVMKTAAVRKPEQKPDGAA